MHDSLPFLRSYELGYGIIPCFSLSCSVQLTSQIRLLKPTWVSNKKVTGYLPYEYFTVVFIDIRVIMTGKTPADGLVNIISYDLGKSYLRMQNNISNSSTAVSKHATLVKQHFKVVIVDERYFLHILFTFLDY